MKLVKNISTVAFAASFMFAGIGFHASNNYSDMDGTTAVAESFGVTYDLNDNTAIGWDSALGMLMHFDAPAGVTLRLGWTATNADACTGDNCADVVANGYDAAGNNDGVIDGDEFDACVLAGDCADSAYGGGNPAGTSIGLGYTWWSGGTGFKTSISTNIDYMMKPNASSFYDAFEDNSTNLSVVVGFGF